MDKKTISILVLALLAGCVFAADVVNYANSNGLEVARSLEVTKTGRVSEITGTVAYSYSSMLTLRVKNPDGIEKLKVVVADDISSIVKDAKIAYSPVPEAGEGKAQWEIGTIKPGESIEIVAKIDAELTRDQLAKLAPPEITVEQVRVSLSATKSVTEGEFVDITLVTDDNRAVPNAKVTAISPSGKKIEMATDEKGGASYRPSEAGTYAYVVENYKVLSEASTEVKPLIKSPPITASVEPSPAATSILGQFTMIIAGLMLVSLVLLAVIAYYSMRAEQPPSQPKQPSRKEEEEAGEVAVDYEEMEEKPAKPSLKEESDRIARAKEMTRRILEARKKELLEKGAKKRKK